MARDEYDHLRESSDADSRVDRTLDPIVSPKEARYWVYMHDNEERHMGDLEETDNLGHAFDAAGAELYSIYLANDMDHITVRVVDRELNGGQTIWLAGPVTK